MCVLDAFSLGSFGCLRYNLVTINKGRTTMKNLLDNITATTRKVWANNEKALFKKYGEYRYRMGVNGLGEVVLTDFRTCQDIAKGNRAVQAKIKELVA